MGDALLEAAVAGDHVGVVVADLGGEVVPEPPLRDPHPDPVGETLAERTGGDLDPEGLMELGMARRPRAPLPEGAEVVEGEPVAGQVQHRVEQDRRVAVREHEAIAVGPERVGRIVPHDPREQHVGERGECHRGSGVARVGCPWGVHRQAPDDVDAELLEIGGDVGWR